MKVLIVSAVFPPEPITSAMTSSDLAEELVLRGHEVTVVSPFPNRPSGRLENGVRRVLRREQQRNGFRLIHTWHTLSTSSSLLSRGFENLSFGLTSALNVALDALPDVAYINTWPIVAQSVMAGVLRAKRIPSVCSVQDIYPESLLGKDQLSPDNLLCRTMTGIDSATLNSCSAVVTISEGMRDLLIEKRGLEPSHVRVIPNWLDERKFPDGLDKCNQFRRSYGIDPETIVALFAGSLTMSAGLELYLDAAERLSDVPGLLLLLVGDGSQRSWLEQQINLRHLSNLRIVCPLLPDEVPVVQAAADLLLLSLKGGTAHFAAPSKQIAYMLSGRPIVASVSSGSTSARLIENASAGFVVPPDDPDALAGILYSCMSHREHLATMGNNGRQFALEHMSRGVILPRLIDLLEEVARS